jgi:hypothetical protein
MAKKKPTGSTSRPGNRPASRPKAGGPKGSSTASPARAAGSSAAPANGSSPAPTGRTAKPADAAAQPAALAAPSRPRGGPTRAERLAAAERARHRRALQTRAAVAGAVALALLVVGFLVVSDSRDGAKQPAGFDSGTCQFDTEADDGRAHVADPTYTVDPPAGGDHNPVPAAAGIYTLENAPADGRLVHSLEHGYIVVWYHPDLPASDLATLRDLALRHSRDVLLVPRASMGTPVAATAWHARLLCGAPDVATLERFIDSYLNKGPEAVPH